MSWLDALGIDPNYEQNREADLIQRQLMGGDPTLRIPPFNLSGARELWGRATGGEDAWQRAMEQEKNAQLMWDLGARGPSMLEAGLAAAEESPFMGFGPGDLGGGGFAASMYGVRPQRLKSLWHGSANADKILEQGFRKGQSAELLYGGTSTSNDPVVSYGSFGHRKPENLLRVSPGNVTPEEVRNLSPSEYALSGKAFKLPVAGEGEHVWNTQTNQWEKTFPAGPRAVSKPQSYYSEKEIFFPTTTGGQAQLKPRPATDAETWAAQRMAMKGDTSGSDEYWFSQGPYGLRNGVSISDPVMRDLYYQKISPAGLIEDAYQQSLASMSPTARREANTIWSGRAGSYLQDPDYTDIIGRLFPQDYETIMQVHMRHGPPYEYSGRARNDAGALKETWDRAEQQLYRKGGYNSSFHTAPDTPDRVRAAIEPEMKAVDDTYRKATKGREFFLSGLEEARGGVNATKLRYQGQIMQEVAPTLMKLPTDVRAEAFNILQSQGMSPIESARWIAREFKDIPANLPNSYHVKEWIGNAVMDKLSGSPQGIMGNSQPTAPNHYNYQAPMEPKPAHQGGKVVDADFYEVPDLSPKAQALINDISETAGLPAPKWAGDVPGWAKSQLDAGIPPHLVQVPFDHVLDIDAAQAYYNSKWGGPFVGPDKVKGPSDAPNSSEQYFQQWLAKHGSAFQGK